MNAVLLLAVVLAVLTAYSLLLLAVCGGKAYRNGYRAAQQQATTGTRPRPVPASRAGRHRTYPLPRTWQ